MPFENGHYKNLPKARTHVTLLDRQGNRILDALVVARNGRQGDLRLAFVESKRGEKNKVSYVNAVANDSPRAADKTLRFRWSYSRSTLPVYAEGKPRAKSGVSTNKYGSGTVTGRFSNKESNRSSLPKVDSAGGLSANGKSVSKELN